MPGFLDLLPRVAEFYLSHTAEIGEQSAQMFNAFKATGPQASSGIQLTLEMLRAIWARSLTGYGRFWERPEISAPY